MKAQKWILAKQFDGFPKDSDFLLVEEEIDDNLKDGEIIVEAVYLSVDPYMRPYMARFPEGSTMIGQQIAKVVKSASAEYPEDSLVLASCGWRSRSKIDTTAKLGPGSMPALMKLPEMSKLPVSLGLGTLGMPGATAYFGLLRICDPKPGETVLVNGAAGAVGSIVGQIAKIKGCKVIGYAGSDDKVKWLKEELGFDFAFNYKTSDLDATLKEAAPNGVDCYFDNVGGDFTYKVLVNHMNRYGRVANCGSIDQYNEKTSEKKTAPYPWFILIGKELKLQGFIVGTFYSEIQTFLKDMYTWILEGKVKYREHVTEGFENMPQAFFGLLKGENTGKAVVRANWDLVMTNIKKREDVL